MDTGLRDSYSTAALCVARVRAYWVNRGYAGIEVWVDSINGECGDGKGAIHEVRSNLRNGIPPGPCVPLKGVKGGSKRPKAHL